MTGIFVSYSQFDRPIAEALATDLRSNGLDVWWDANLYAGEDYHDAIMQALEASKAVIVIWSENSIKSQWVRDEATRANADKKLITTYVAPFNLKHIPLGMGQHQTVDVANRAEIIKALGRYGVEARSTDAPMSILALTADLDKAAASETEPSLTDRFFSAGAKSLQARLPDWADMPEISKKITRCYELLTRRPRNGDLVVQMLSTKMSISSDICSDLSLFEQERSTKLLALLNKIYDVVETIK